MNGKKQPLQLEGEDDFQRFQTNQTKLISFSIQTTELYKKQQLNVNDEKQDKCVREKMFVTRYSVLYLSTIQTCGSFRSE